MKPTACLWRAALARSPGAWLSRARHALSADVPCLPRRYGQSRRAVPALLERDALYRAALLRAPRHAVRARPRPGPHLATGDGGSAGVQRGPARWRRFEDGPARTLVHRLKYSDRAELARPIASWMARAGADVLADADLLTPVPLHALRLWRRRFNQAAALTAEISRQTGKPCDLAALRRDQGDPQPSGFEPSAKGRKCPGRVPGRRERGGAGA